MEAQGPVEGWGVDGDVARRPGVPMELPPRPREGAREGELERQRAEVEVLKRAGLEALPPVFGTAQPPRGVSGWLRRRAYEIPEHAVSHLALLLVADRVDAVEWRLRSTPAQLLGTAVGLVWGGWLLQRMRG